MDIQTKHYNTILNAKCEVVCMADNLIKKSNYGDDIGCCSAKLFAAISLINRLECYCFENYPVAEVEVDAVFRTIFGDIEDVPAGSFCSITANGTQLYGFYNDSTLSPKEILEIIFQACNIPYQYIQNGSSNRFLISMQCFTESVSASITTEGVDTNFEFTNIIAGECTSKCNNCIEDSNLNNMYEVLHGLLK